jgi:hypothetical protein
MTININIPMTLIIIALTAGLTLTVGRRLARSRPVLAVLVCGSVVPLLQAADGILMFVNRPQLPPPFDATLPPLFDVTTMMLHVMVIGTITTALVTFLTSTLIIVVSTVRGRRS